MEACPYADNPADLARRRDLVTNTELWLSGPVWLRDSKKWPGNTVTEKSQASEKETKVIKKVSSKAKSCPKEEQQSEFDRLLNSGDLSLGKRFTTHRDHKNLSQARTCKKQETGGLEEFRTWIRRSLNLHRRKMH